MTSDEMFVSTAQESGDLAGVFEHDGETAYFYLYDQSKPAGQRIFGAIHILFGRSGFPESDVEVRWTSDDETVGFFVHGRLWAAFRGGEKYGGNYRDEGRADIPESVIALFGAD